MKLTPKSKVLIQGMTEPLVSTHAARMKAYGTNIVAIVSPSEGGQTVEDMPVFDLVEQAIASVGTVDTTIIFVPPYEVLDAANEAIAAGIRQIIIISAGVPPLDMVHLLRKTEAAEINGSMIFFLTSLTETNKSELKRHWYLVIGRW